MLFQELRRFNLLVHQYNREAFGQKAELFNPHMFLDGQWSVAIIFGKVPVLFSMWGIVAYCYYQGLHAFWGEINGKITLFIQ